MMVSKIDKKAIKRLKVQKNGNLFSWVFGQTLGLEDAIFYSFVFFRLECLYACYYAEMENINYT